MSLWRHSKYGIRSNCCDTLSVQTEPQTNEIIGTAFYLKLFGGIIAVTSALIIINSIRPHDILTLTLVGIIVAGMIF